MKKRLISLLLVFCMVFSLVPTTAFAANGQAGTTVELANPFKDVKETDWFYDAVQYARINSFFNGTSKTTFEPNGTMTRGMFVTVLGRMAGVDADNYKGKSAFTDVKANASYAPYVAWASKYGITTGTGDGKFSPDALINRQQMATFFVRYFEAFGVDYDTDANITTTPADIDSVASYAKDAVLKLWKTGLLNGDGTNFNPEGNASRAQAATLCMRTDEAVDTWYKEPGVPSDRVRIDPTTGLPFGQEPVTPAPGDDDDDDGDDPYIPPYNPPSFSTYSVKFYDGSKLIDTLYAEKNEPLGEVPSVEKSSKANAFLVGYFTDPECTQPFYAENPVTGNMNVYAKYEEMGTGETLTFTSFAQMDQGSDISFEISGSGDPAQAVTLEVMDGSDPVELKFTGSNGNYTVSAVNGFNEGCSYQLHLADGWTFTGKADSIRTASFSIYKEQVENLQMSDDIIYIEDTDAIDYMVDGRSYDMLTSELITKGGRFDYSGAAVAVDDILCIYTGVHPEQRGMNADTLDPAHYVKVKAVSGTAITFEALGEDDFLRLYNIPDNFPIRVEVLPTEATGTVNISALDADIYAEIMGEGYDLAAAKEAMEAGDFISLFVSKEDINSEEKVRFGEVTAYNAATGEITYKKITRQDILDSMDLYRDIEISGNDLVTEEEREEIEATLQQQVEASGFAEDAAFMLADLITKTDGFRNADLRSVLITDSEGNELSPEQLQLLNLGASFELTDDIDVDVNFVTEGDQLHYEDGIQLAVSIGGEFEVELEDDEKIAIELEATFVQEVEIDPRIKGYIVPYFFGVFPLPVGVNASGTIDIKSFTAFSFEAEIFTVGPEEKDLWEQFKDIVENPEKLANLPGMPEELSKGLTTVGDVFDKIEELENNMAKVKEDAETYLGYAEDLEAIWAYVEENGLTTKEDWKGMCEALDKTSITSDLLDMMDMTNETELETEYYETMEALMERYCEMVEKETDWVTLFNEDLWSSPEICVYGISMSIDIDFVARADLSLAIGSNMQYEVGKRYEFYFKFATFYHKAGYTSMDLLDESFAFQFYVMGRLGLKAGINAKFEVGIGSTTLANIGVALELGPYMKFWGFFVYEYEEYRPANTSDWHSDERMAGAVLLEFGLYLKMAFEAEALDGAFNYEYEFLDEEFPLLTVGEEHFYYQPNYEPAEDESVLVKDVDNDSGNGITMTLPAYMLALDYVNMREGYMAIAYPDYDRFNYTVSNPNFSVDPDTGIISVTVPEDTRYMECDLTITYKYGKLAFSTYDMTVTVPLVWTNLSTEELSEYFTAAVRVGNDEDGYTTVWSRRVLKNQEYDLPTVDEIKEIIGWNDYKYDMGTGYGSQQTEDLTLIEDEVYDFNIDYDTYFIHVANVETADGDTETRTYTAQYGEMFDFSDLAETGTNANGVYTKFSELTHNIEGLDLNKAIDSRMADILAGGAAVYANYVDNSITATFVFTGLDAENHIVLLRRGDEPDLTVIERIVEDAGMAIKDITPAISPITASTLYQVICGELDTEPATITFEENGGSEVNDITKPYGSLIGSLPTSEKTGYTLEGWYADEGLTQRFELTKMPQGGATAYAKWTANEYTVTFHVNGGNALDDNDMTVTYGEAYGTLPEADRNGYGFTGWFTAAEGGEQITAESIYNLTEDQTLYAQWRELVVISDDIFDFGATEEYTYERTGSYADPTAREPEYTFTAEDIELSSFTFTYKAQGMDEYEEGLPNLAGVYDVRITRPADNTYAIFEEYYENVLIINKADRKDSYGGYLTPAVGMKMENYVVEACGLSSIGVRMITDRYLGLFDADPNLMVRLAAFPYGEYSTVPDISEAISVSDYVPYPQAADYSELIYTESDLIYLYGLEPGTQYTILVELSGDRNYEDMYFVGYDYYNDNPYQYNAIGTSYVLHPNDTWLDDANRYDTAWYDENPDTTEFHIDTEQELAGLAYLVNSGTSFNGKTIYLDADLNMYWYQWVPIGNTYYAFTGTFDGQGHTISGLYFNNNSSTNVGLFGVLGYQTSGGIVKNLSIADSYIRGGSNVGGIAGQLAGVGLSNVHNCTVASDVYVSAADGAVGGIAGNLKAWSSVFICVNYGTVHGDYTVGGIVGNCGEDTVIINNANFGRVTADAEAVGGIVGDMRNFLNGCTFANNYSVGKITAQNTAGIGALVGLVEEVVSEFGGNNFYLEGAAIGVDNSGREIPMRAFGGAGSASDGAGGATAQPITTMEALLAALNDYVDAFEPSLGTEDPNDGDNGFHGHIREFELSTWDMDDNGYLVPVLGE